MFTFAGKRPPCTKPVLLFRICFGCGVWGLNPWLPWAANRAVVHEELKPEHGRMHPCVLARALVVHEFVRTKFFLAGEHSQCRSYCWNNEDASVFSTRSRVPFKTWFDHSNRLIIKEKSLFHENRSFKRMIEPFNAAALGCQARSIRFTFAPHTRFRFRYGLGWICNSDSMGNLVSRHHVLVPVDIGAGVGAGGRVRLGVAGARALVQVDHLGWTTFIASYKCQHKTSAKLHLSHHKYYETNHLGWTTFIASYNRAFTSSFNAALSCHNPQPTTKIVT